MSSGPGNRARLSKDYQEEGIKAEGLQQIIADYLIAEQKAVPNTIIKVLGQKQGVRTQTDRRITQKVFNFWDVLICGIG